MRAQRLSNIQLYSTGST
uniref:Uncharacterized protein n=1 Tax=Anguilla anguilla TaxID=7936 RepID=A0A0E9RCJ5_ANGAN